MLKTSGVKQLRAKYQYQYEKIYIIVLISSLTYTLFNFAFTTFI